MALGGGLGTVDAGAELGDIEIHLEDALLAPQRLDQDGERGLDALAEVTTARPQEQILGDLLRDGRSAATLARLPVAGVGLLDRFQIKTMVIPELLVLGGDRGLAQHARDFLRRHPAVIDLGLALQHEGRGRRRQPAQRQHGQRRQQKQHQQHPEQRAQPRALAPHALDCGPEPARRSQPFRLQGWRDTRGVLGVHGFFCRLKTGSVRLK
jgi:hypothetical protein